jgi:hypothetical protein
MPLGLVDFAALEGLINGLHDLPVIADDALFEGVPGDSLLISHQGLVCGTELAIAPARKSRLRRALMARVPRLIQVFNVQCVMCGRAAGQLMNGMFVPNQRVAKPIAGKSGSRCGECGGNLYLEPDESITPFMATQIVAQKTPSQQPTPPGLRAA